MRTQERLVRTQEKNWVHTQERLVRTQETHSETEEQRVPDHLGEEETAV